MEGVSTSAKNILSGVQCVVTGCYHSLLGILPVFHLVQQLVNHVECTPIIAQHIIPPIQKRQNQKTTFAMLSTKWCHSLCTYITITINTYCQSQFYSAGVHELCCKLLIILTIVVISFSWVFSHLTMCFYQLLNTWLE